MLAVFIVTKMIKKDRFAFDGSTMKNVLSAVVAGLSLAQLVAGLSFTLEGDTTKCLQEDVEKDVLVMGDYSISGNKPVEVTLEVRVLTRRLSTWLNVHFYAYCTIPVRSPTPVATLCIVKRMLTQESSRSHQTTMTSLRSVSTAKHVVSQISRMSPSSSYLWQRDKAF
jgi:hypothetical protein